MIDTEDWNKIKLNTTPTEALKLVSQLKKYGISFTPLAATEMIKYLGSKEIMEAIRDATVIPDKSDT